MYFTDQTKVRSKAHNRLLKRAIFCYIFSCTPRNHFQNSIADVLGGFLWHIQIIRNPPSQNYILQTRYLYFYVNCRPDGTLYFDTVVRLKLLYVLTQKSPRRAIKTIIIPKQVFYMKMYKLRTR